MELRGSVIQKKFGAQSKSEHAAVLLTTDQGTYRLRRRGGNPFRDPELDQLVGHEIICQATIHQDTVLMDSWQVVNEK